MAGGKGRMSGTGWHYQNYFPRKNKSTPIGNEQLSEVVKTAPYAVFQYVRACCNFVDGRCSNSNDNNVNNPCKCLINKTSFCNAYSSKVTMGAKDIGKSSRNYKRHNWKEYKR